MIGRVLEIREFSADSFIYAPANTVSSDSGLEGFLANHDGEAGFFAGVGGVD